MRHQTAAHTWLSSWRSADVFRVSLCELKSLLRQIALLAYWQIEISSCVQDKHTPKNVTNLASLDMAVNRPRAVVSVKHKLRRVQSLERLSFLFFTLLMSTVKTLIVSSNTLSLSLSVSLSLFVFFFFCLCLSSSLIWLYRIKRWKQLREREILDR